MGEHAASVIPVGGFDHHGQADILCRLPGFLRGCNDSPLWHRNSALRKQSPGEFFVARNPFGDGAGAIGFGGPNASLLAPVTELNEVSFVQAHHRNTPVFCGRCDGCRAGAEPFGLSQITQCVDCRIEVEWAVCHRGENQIASNLKRESGDGLLLSADDDAVNAAFAGFARPTKARLETNKTEQFQRNMFENVRWPGPLIQTLKESAADPGAASVLDQAGQPGGQAFRKSRDSVGRKVLEGANVHLGFEDRAIGPDVWTAQNDLADEFDRVRELIHTSDRLQGECLGYCCRKRSIGALG